MITATTTTTTNYNTPKGARTTSILIDIFDKCPNFVVPCVPSFYRIENHDWVGAQIKGRIVRNGKFQHLR